MATTTDKYELHWKNEITNLWEKIDDNLWSLTITNKNHTIKSIVDSNLVSTLKQHSWTLWRANKRSNQIRENKFYVKHGKTKTLDHCCIHEYILRLNNIEKPDDGQTYSVDHIES